MRVIGVEIPPAVTGGAPTYVPVGSLAVLFGANDTGKTRLLRSIEDGLSTRGLRQMADDAMSAVPSLYLHLDGPPFWWADEVFGMQGVEEIPGRRSDLAVFGRS